MADSDIPEAPAWDISKVPNEIWIKIFHALDFDYPALGAVYATCGKFHQCVQPALFYHLHVHLVENTVFEYNPFEKRIAYHRTWVQFKDVRVLEISDTHTHVECMTRVSRSLRSLFRLIPRVRIIKWRSRLEIDQTILEMFTFLQRPIILDIQGAHEIFDYNATIRPILRACPLMNIRSLDINMENWDQEYQELKGNLFPICSVPTLEALTLTYRATAPGFRVCNVRVQRGCRLAPLKSLRLYNVCFVGEDGSDWTRCLNGLALRHLTLDGYFVSMVPLKLLAGKVPNLKSLSVRLRNEEDQIHEPVSFDIMENFLIDAAPGMSYMLSSFLRGVRALEEFSGYDLPLKTLEDVMVFQGHALETLRFRDTVARKSNRGHGSVFLGCRELMWMSIRLPALRRLGITMAIGSQTVPMLNYISRFPNLTHLELSTPPILDPADLAHRTNTRNNNAANERPPPPSRSLPKPIPESLVQNIFHYVAGRKAYYSALTGNNRWKSFDRLEFTAREYEPMIEGMPLAFWGLRKVSISTCTRKIGAPGEVELSVVTARGWSLMCVHRYNQVLNAAGVWDRRGVYAISDANGLDCLID
ncbi:hypothetical protein P170DRAFT_427748 [Aspergillus steynii IBT 23096]|uniref:F-box domain-containing protein n=1 Tax=Aspergillus steynii IBT 23096 TaxID=1392250 RepID=A0A2I2G0M7_9EURO|nr:uncharacterized protein P170DRAFT_427748 [Aspergillus steynii IBT 23096]PLB46428.1 hypothetical protein P170DRAFT_427748 [Aspergillus steynii IBT 23096]